MSCTRYASMKSLRARLVAGQEPAWLANHSRRQYIVQAVLASPPWVDLEELYKLRDEARRLTVLLRADYTLDHIVPLNHPRVCGLNVHWNIRVVPYKVNARKANTFFPEQLHLRLGERQTDLFQIDAEDDDALLAPIESRVCRDVDDCERRNGRIVQVIHNRRPYRKPDAAYFRRKQPCRS